jgi:uncharacterized protein (AIM24 family)
MQSQIVGTVMPVLEFVLEPNEAVISEAGELSWMGGSIQMTTHTQMGGGGGLFGVLKRVAGGGTLFMTEYRAVGARGELAFATKVPGHILPVEIGQGHEYMIHRHGFLCATPQVNISVGFQQSLGAGIFGGDGFLLQHVSGLGTAWIELSGELIVKDLQSGRDVACASRTRWRVPDQRVVSDHDRAGDQEHDLWRRRNFSGCSYRSRESLVADTPDFEACTQTDGVHASALEGSGTGRSRRRNRRIDS